MLFVDIEAFFTR